MNANVQRVVSIPVFALFAPCLLASALSAAAQERIVIEEQAYLREGGKWYLTHQGARYEVNPRVVTIKLAEGVTAAARSALPRRRGSPSCARAGSATSTSRCRRAPTCSTSCAA